MGSPRKGLEMESVRGEAGVGQRAAHEVGPRLGAAEVDVTLGDVGDPVAESGEVVDSVRGADPVPEPGVGTAPASGEVEDLRPYLAGAA